MLCRKCCKELPDGAKYCCWCGINQTITRNKRTRGNGTGTVFKRGKTWRCEITLGKKPDGSPDRRTKDGFKTKKEAIEYLPTLKGEKPKKAKTFLHYYNSYSTHEMLSLGRTTQGAYKIAWRKISDIHNRAVRDLSVVFLRDLVSEVAPTHDTAGDVKSLLSHLFKLAIADQEATVNLSEYIPLPPKNDGERTPWTNYEQQIIWKGYADGEVIASYLLLMIYTGMMPGELMNCKRSMIDFDKKIIVGAGLKTTKRKSTPIVLADIILPVVKTILTYTPDNDDENQPILWCDKTSFYEAYHDFTKKYNIRDLPVYSCRHTTATALAVKDVAPSVIQKVMRHSKFATTQHYIHPDSTDALTAVNKI